MHTENSERGWYLNSRDQESSANRAERERVDRYYAACDSMKEAEARSDFSAARKYDAIMRQNMR